MSTLTPFSSHLLSTGSGLDPTVQERYGGAGERPTEGDKEKAQGDLIHAYKLDKESFFKAVSSHRTRDTGHKLKHKITTLNIRKHLFTMRGTYHRSSREVVGSWAMEIFKSHQDTVLDMLLCSGGTV